MSGGAIRAGGTILARGGLKNTAKLLGVVEVDRYALNTMLFEY